MCRLGIYTGPAISLRKFIFDPPHNFIEQSRSPKEMVITPINGDGYGAGWYNLEIHPEPALLTSEKPFWHDTNLVRISDKILSPHIFMHIRAASPGLGIHHANAHPFQWQEFLFMHNGIVSDFKKGFMRSLRQQIADPYYSQLHGTTDSEHIFGLFLTVRDEDPQLRMADAMLEVFARLNDLAMRHGSDLILNLALTDGHTTIATNYTTINKAATLYYTDSSPAFPDAVMVCSEPLDRSDDAWKKFPVNQMMIIHPDRMFEFIPIPNPFVKDGLFPHAQSSTLKIASPVTEK
ncbi:MAG: class II glutamine amidotransferase [Rhizobacter sp.]|nr:class II glutamine amidotransferase [Chlorobiales bacterium]